MQVVKKKNRKQILKGRFLFIYFKQILTQVAKNKKNLFSSRDLNASCKELEKILHFFFFFFFFLFFDFLCVSQAAKANEKKVKGSEACGPSSRLNQACAVPCPHCQHPQSILPVGHEHGEAAYHMCQHLLHRPPAGGRQKHTCTSLTFPSHRLSTLSSNLSKNSSKLCSLAHFYDTPLLQKLHWLPAELPIKYTACVYAHTVWFFITFFCWIAKCFGPMQWGKALQECYTFHMHT